MKVYYLTMRQINFIFNYINKTDHFISSDLFTEANKIGDMVCLCNTGKKLLYSGLICVDILLNTNVYTFTNFKKKEHQIKIFEKISPRSTFKPKIKSLVKLIKYLTNSFPSYSTEFFMYHLYSKPGVSNALAAQDLVMIKSLLSKKSIEIHSIQQNSNITIKNINLNSNSYGRHYKNTSSTRDSSHFNKVLPKSKLNSNSASDNSLKSLTKGKYVLPNKLNFSTNHDNVFVVARDNQIRYKTELDDSEDSIVKPTKDYNTPTKKKVVRYYS
jgi:hypothetical protein